jgi:hypothetical protein
MVRYVHILRQNISNWTIYGAVYFIECMEYKFEFFLSYSRHMTHENFLNDYEVQMYELKRS